MVKSRSAATRSALQSEDYGRPDGHLFSWLCDPPYRCLIERTLIGVEGDAGWSQRSRIGGPSAHGAVGPNGRGAEPSGLTV